jgi:ATP citrate (pro-S)-lyase
MAQKAIREADAKRMLARLLPEYTKGVYVLEDRFVSVDPETDLNQLPQKHEWLLQERLVAKPDQLIKRRGKNNLLLLNASWAEVKGWVEEKKGKRITVGNVTGVLEHFIIEPYIPHEEKDEYYLAIISVRAGDEILFYHPGGVNVGDIDAKASHLTVPIGEFPNAESIARALLCNVPEDLKPSISSYIEGLFKFYADLNYTYLEINPLVVLEKEKIFPLDLAAKLDDTAGFISGRKWGKIIFPPPFGRVLTKEEAFIEELDSKTGASLKLTILNPEGRIWLMIAGGGASVIYADTITDLGYMQELANYGEYSGDPNENFTYLYAKTIIDLMTRKKHEQGKALLIGGGISNFTDVVSTFSGVIRAIREYQEKLRDHGIKIFVRRGGLNYKEGLKLMEKLGTEIAVPIKTFGPETHMTKIVPMAINSL